MERTTGRRFRCRYAAVTDVRTGLSLLADSTARHCRYRALGLAIGEPSGAAYAGDHALHVSSGVSVLPDRVNSSIWLPAPLEPCQLSAPHVAIVCASRGSAS